MTVPARTVRSLAVAFALVLFAGACAGGSTASDDAASADPTSAESTTVDPARDPEPSEPTVAAPTATPTVEPSATPQPTATAAPTATPEPTPTPLPAVACIAFGDLPDASREQTMTVFNATSEADLMCLHDTANVNQLVCGDRIGARNPTGHDIVACAPDDRFAVTGRLVPEDDAEAIASYELLQAFVEVADTTAERFVPPGEAPPPAEEAERALAVLRGQGPDGQSLVVAYTLWPSVAVLAVGLTDGVYDEDSVISDGLMAGFVDEDDLRRVLVIDDGVATEATQTDIERVGEVLYSWLDGAEDTSISIRGTLTDSLPSWFTLLALPSGQAEMRDRMLGSPPATNSAPGTSSAPPAANPTTPATDPPAPQPTAAPTFLSDAEVAERCAAAAADDPPEPDDGSIGLSVRILTVDGVEYLCPR